MRRLMVALGMVALGMLALCLAGVSAVAQQPVVNIGVVFSTTGATASLGIPNNNAILMAPKEYGGVKVNYIYLDDASDPDIAVQDVKRLISQDNIDLLLGPSTTPDTVSVIDTMAAAHVPMITMGSASLLVLPMDAKKKWVFKMPPNDNVFGTPVINHMVSKGVKTISLIVADDPYGETWVNIMTKLAAEKGIKILTVEKINRADTSALPQALRAMQGNPDAIVVGVSGTAADLPCQALYQRGYKGLIYLTGGMVNPDFLRVGGKAVEGIYSPSPPLVIAPQLPDGYPTKKVGVEFYKAYEARFGPNSISQYAGHSWDATKILEVAIPIAAKKAKPGTLAFREALRDAMENDTKNIVGVQAVYNMTPEDHCGIDARGVAMVQVVNGAWKLVGLPAK